MNSHQNPSEALLLFLAWFCPPKLYESIEGDILEQFAADIAAVGIRRARHRMFWNVLKFLRPGILLRHKFSITIIQVTMIRNYIKVASRNIRKRKLYAFINSVGLSIGIAFCILIYLFIQDERDFDQFHSNRDLIYRMEVRSFDTWQPDPGRPFETNAWLQTGLKQVLIDEVPEVEMATRFNTDVSGIFRFGEKAFTENITFVDQDFFRMFSFRLLAGNIATLFDDRYEVVLTSAVAEKYFDDQDPLGKQIVLDFNGEKAFTVTGVIETPTSNSSLDFQILVPQENRSGYEQNLPRWSNYNSPTFVQLIPHADLTNFSRNLDKVVDKYLGQKLKERRSESVVPVPEDAKMVEYIYTNLADIHLNNEISWPKVSDPQYSYILGGIALLILIIAAINYISLALTSSAGRRTEVGIRKVVGAKKKQIVYQFGFESIVVALISMVIGIGLAILFLPSFNDFTNKGITITGSDILPILAFSLAMSLAVGIIAGSYPALFLSGFNPSVVLKGRSTAKLRAGFTKPLVILQFAISAFLIISSVIMFRQMNFVTSKDLGYNSVQVLVVPTHAGWNDKSDQIVERFRERLRMISSVMSMAGTTTAFASGYSRNGYEINGEQHSAFVYGVDPDYINTLGIDLAMGRNFNVAMPADSDALIVNEALVRDMQWDEPLNEYLNWRGDTVGLGSKIIGVVKDYHFLSLSKSIEPLFLSMDRENVGHLTTMLVRVGPGNLQQSVESIRDAWKEISPNTPFDYSFLDEDVARQYESYQRWTDITGLSTGFAILISCLGLFGLAGINALNRTREIGIRKVMGAELMNIFVLLNTQYIWLAIIAFGLAAPASWYVMQQWLSDFEFSISLQWELFAVSMAVGIFVALAAVSYHAIKVALVNPADTLKHQ